MSFQAMTWAVNAECKGAAQKLVLLMLANHTNGHTGQCNPSHKLLAKECCMSVSSLKDQIKQLEENGFLQIIRKTQDGVNLPNQYILNIEEPEYFGMSGSKSDRGVGQNLAEGGSKSDRGVGQNLATKQEYINLEMKQEENQEHPPFFAENENPPEKEEAPQSTQPCYEWAISNPFWSSKITSLAKFLELYANPSPNGLKAQYNASLKAEKDKEWQTLPVYDDDLVKFAEKHGFTPPKGFDSYQQYRQALRRDIQNRIKSERKMAA